MVRNNIQNNIKDKINSKSIILKTNIFYRNLRTVLRTKPDQKLRAQKGIALIQQRMILWNTNQRLIEEKKKPLTPVIEEYKNKFS